MPTNIALSNGVRQNLLSLQQTADLQAKTQLKLATGKKVNSAVDNPTNFFTAAGLNDRANQLAALLDGISNGIKTIEAADKGITGISKLVESLQATVRQALNDAAQNRPKISGTGTTLAGAAEVTATGKTLKQIAEGKLLEGAAAAATSTTPGNLGVAANSRVTIAVGGTAAAPGQTYSFTTTATMTVRDFVNQINNSGLATANVDENGRLQITGTGSGVLRIGVGTLADPDANNAALGLDGTAGTGDWEGGESSALSSAVRSNLIKQFNDTRNEIGKLAKDSGYNGTNLLDGNLLKIVLNEKTGAARNSLDIQGFNVSATDLGILQMNDGVAANTTNVQDDNSLNAALEALTNTLTTLRSMASTLGSNLAIVETREEFTNNLITTLKSGADNLVIADPNEEGANLLALNTRQQLSQTALSLASQADQSVLRLFG